MFIKNQLFLFTIGLLYGLSASLYAARSQLFNSPLNTPRTIYHKQYILMGEVQLPKDRTLPFPLQAYFNGQRNDPYEEMTLYAKRPSQVSYGYDPSFTITVSAPYSDLYILVTQQFHGQSARRKDIQGNIIEHLKLLEGQPYLCFHCRRTFYLAGQDGKQELSSWHIEQVQLDSNSQNYLRIPENTIIIIADPEWIESLAAHEWDARSAVIKLPTLVFKPTVTQKELNDLSVIINLSRLDHCTFHTPTRKATKQAHPGLVISMSTPAHEIIPHAWHRNIL